MVDLNATQAVIRAGYKTKNPNRMGAELLVHPLVKELIEEKLQEKRERRELDESYVITKLVDIVDATERANPQAALRGLELLGKHLGLYKDRQEISGPDGEAIKMEQQTRENVQEFTNKLSRLIRRENDDEKVVDFGKRANDE